MHKSLCRVCRFPTVLEGDRVEYHDYYEGCMVCGYFWQHSYGAYRCYIGEREWTWGYRECGMNEASRLRNLDMDQCGWDMQDEIGAFTDEFRGFAQQLLDNPSDFAICAVFADWLEERGAMWLAQWHRNKIPKGALER